MLAILLLLCYYWPITDSVTISLRIIFMALFPPKHQVQMQRLKSQTTDVNAKACEAGS